MKRHVNWASPRTLGWAAGVLIVLTLFGLWTGQPKATPASSQGIGTGKKVRSESLASDWQPGTTEGELTEFPPDAQEITMTVKDGRRSSSGWTIILQSEKSMRDRAGKYSTPPGTKVLLVPSQIWSELPDKRVIGRTVKAMTVPMLDSDSTFKVLALTVAEKETQHQ